MESPVTPAEPPIDGSVRRLPIEFTGAGGEYFRIWIVNMLLLMVTLGLYWPWAKVRRLRYFWGNTLVDGDPLDFHGEPGQMFKGWALVGVLFLLYNWAGSVSALADVVAFVALGLLWPALWRSSMAFRLGNTSWRGLRFRFVGSMRDAYASLLPLFLVALPLVLLGLWVPDEPEASVPDWVGLAFFGVMALAVCVMPWLLWRMKAYQHRHYALGPLQTDFRASVGAFYVLALKSAGMLLLVSAVMILPALGLGLLASASAEGLSFPGAGTMGAVVLLPVLLMLLVIFGMGPWWTTRLQNLVWTKTGNSQMRFISRLSFRSMLWLGLKNGLLTAVTLGLYWPFAAVAMARLRLEAVHIRSIVDLEDLLAADHQRPAEAAGEAAGDFFGMDVGL